MYKNILVAFDGSDGSVTATKAASELAGLTGAGLVVLFAYEQPAFYGAMLGGGAINGVESIDPRLFDDYRAAREATVRGILDASLTGVNTRYKYRVEVGPPAATVARVAEEEKCDLIVVGSRGLGGVQLFLLGSVSERIAHLAHCSVLIVR